MARTIPLLLRLLLLLSLSCRRAGAETDKGFLVFEHSILRQLARDYVPAPNGSPGAISCSLARGQYRSLCVGVHAAGTDLKAVRLEIASDLGSRVYRPIDAETGSMLAAQKEPVPEWIHHACLDEDDEIRSIPRGTTSYFWITLHADETTAPGGHAGRLLVRPAGGPAVELTLDLEVHPFVLQRARIAYAPFIDEPQYLPDFVRGNDEWIARVFRDLAEHSHNSMIGLGHCDAAAHIDVSTIPPRENRTLQVLLPLAAQSGLTRPDIPIIHYAHPMTLPEDEGGPTVAAKNRFMAWYETARLARGWPELAAYGSDEPRYPNPELRRRYASFRDVRMRLATAMNAHAAYGLGDLHDIWIVWGGQVTPEMCREAERMGAEVWTYVCRELSTRPLRERHYAGVYIWALRLRGHTTWHYYAQGGYKLVWFRNGSRRPMPLTGWEARREGIDDYRYLQMLEDGIAAKPDNPVALEARRWLAGLRARITVDPHQAAPGRPLEIEEYDRVRHKAAAYIRQLGPILAERISPVTHARLKDEAEPFRARSVQACVAGLKSGQGATRRAAAWALFEIGPAAAPAVASLADCLADAEVRIPALRALEAIGPATATVVPELTALLKHPDGFVRLAAVYALGATGAPRVEVLTQALQDDYYPVAQAAGRMMTALGPAGMPALPVLIRMLDGPGWEKQEPALKAIEGIGPEAVSAVPHILRNWNGRFPAYVYWIEPLAAIGPNAEAAVPMLEAFRADRSQTAVVHRRAHGIDAISLFALYRIRGAPEDLKQLVNLIGSAHRPESSQALMYLERLGPDASPAAPQIRELIAQDQLSEDVRKRLEKLLESR